MGYGLIAINKNNISMIEMGVLQLAKHDDHAVRLQLIYEKLQQLIKIHKPIALAIEAPFFGKNVQSMLKLGRAQGVAIAAGMSAGLKAVEYAPRKIKQSITGRGNASKEQVWEMLQHTLGFQESPEFMDATDAVAVALCHHYESKMAALMQEPAIPKKRTSKKQTSWASFVLENPDKIR